MVEWHEIDYGKIASMILRIVLVVLFSPLIVLGFAVGAVCVALFFGWSLASRVVDEWL